jgi:NhaP-type Na+/H+ or K+/H+ antiporter
MYLNWHHVKGGLFQSIILAGPGVLIGAALMGVFARFLLPYDLPWNFALIFGSILSATDPVAVVALLKSVGASPKLTFLILGESLLNDGSAMVLFTIFYNSVNGTLYTPGSVVSFMFSAALGSVVVGVVIGLCTVRWLRTANRSLGEIDVPIQIAVTICCAYLTFFVAQNTLEMSGVLA